MLQNGDKVFISSRSNPDAISIFPLREDQEDPKAITVYKTWSSDPNAKPVYVGDRPSTGAVIVRLVNLQTS